MECRRRAVDNVALGLKRGALYGMGVLALIKKGMHLLPTGTPRLSGSCSP